MSTLALESARDNSLFLIEQALEKGVDRPEHAGSAFFTITRAYRRLAIVSLLLDLDVEAFRDHLCRSAHAYVEFRRRLAAGLVVAPRYACASNAVAFADALAAGALDQAREIARSFDDRHSEEVEYEDDFLRERMQHRLLLAAPEAELEAGLRRWRQVVGDARAVFLDVTRAIASRSAEAFDSAFDALLARRDEVLEDWRRMPNYREDAGSTEGRVFVEALGLLRLAELRGIPTRPDYKHVPAPARIPLGAPLPPPDSWRTP
jgi:hypothetical protein